MGPRPNDLLIVPARPEQDSAGVPGLEPRLAEPESARLPITPYPMGRPCGPSGSLAYVSAGGFDSPDRGRKSSPERRRRPDLPATDERTRTFTRGDVRLIVLTLVATAAAAVTHYVDTGPIAPFV